MVKLKKVVVLNRKVALGDVILLYPLLEFLVQTRHVTIVLTDYPRLFTSRRKLRTIKWKLFKHRLFRVLDNIGILDYYDLNRSYLENTNISITSSYFASLNYTGDWKKFVSRIGLFHTGNLKLITESDKKIALFHLQGESSKLPYRSIHGIDWSTVESRLNALGYRCFEILSKSENTKPLLRNVIQVEYWQLFDLFGYASLFVGRDSAPGHVANILGIKSLVFFGSVNPKLRFTKKVNGYILQNECKYQHCYHEDNLSGVPCKINVSEPPCCTFETDLILNKIGRAIQT